MTGIFVYAARELVRSAQQVLEDNRPTPATPAERDRRCFTEAASYRPYGRF